MGIEDITIVYPSYAGGKFIGNCLGMSKDVMPNLSRYRNNLEHLLYFRDDYDFRLDFVSSTIPDNRNKMSLWGSYESFSHDKNSSFYSKAKSKNFKFCFTNLGEFEIKEDSGIVNLKKYNKFRKIAHNLKKSVRLSNQGPWTEQRYNLIKGNAWPEYEELSDIGFDTNFLQNYSEDIKQEILKYYPIGSYKKVFHFDMSKIFNYNMFINEMKKVYVFLGLVDFPEDYIKVYYKKYIDLHSIEFIE